MMRWAAMVVAAVIAASPSARAQSNDKMAQAKEYLIAGREAFAKARYADAVKAFEAGLAITESANLVFSLAASYQKLYFSAGDTRHLRKAIDGYRRYRRLAPEGKLSAKALEQLEQLEPLWQILVSEGKVTVEDPSAPPEKQATEIMISAKAAGAKVTLVDKGVTFETGVAQEVDPGTYAIRVEAPGYIPQTSTATAIEGRFIVTQVALEPKSATVEVDAPAAASVAVDGLRMRHRFEVRAGEHLVTVAQRGYRPVSRTIDVKRGQTLILSAPLEKTKQRKASYWVMGGAGALAASGVVTWVLALSAQGDARDIEDARGVDPLTPDDLEERDDALSRRDGYRTATYVLFGTAITTAAVGAALYWFDVPIAPAAGPETVGVALSTSF